jgi:hypothetical protein
MHQRLIRHTFTNGPSLLCVCFIFTTFWKLSLFPFPCDSYFSQLPVTWKIVVSVFMDLGILYLITLSCLDHPQCSVGNHSNLHCWSSKYCFAVANNFVYKINCIDFTITGIKASGMNSVIDATPIKFYLPNALQTIML